MMLTTFRVEPRSDSPSALQNAMDACTLAINTAGFAASLASPFHLAMMAYRLNRSMARLWGVG